MKFKVESARYSNGYIEIEATDDKLNLFTIKGVYDNDHMIVEEGTVHIDATEEEREMNEKEMNAVEYDSEIQVYAQEIYEEYIAPDEYDYYLGMSNENY